MPLLTNKLLHKSNPFTTTLWKLIDITLPPLCPVNGNIVSKNGQLSPEGWKTLTFLSSPECSICGIPFAFSSGDHAENMICANCLDKPPDYDRALSVLKYDDVSKNLILKFKHGDHLHLVESFAPMMAQRFLDSHLKIDAVIPVPLHWRRLLKRRYNQSALLANSLSQIMGTPYMPHLLKRIKYTLPQGHSGAGNREKNVKNCFAVCNKAKTSVKGKTFLLIDDVMTSGATLSACAKELKKSGAEKVYCLCIAKVVKD